MPVIDLTVQRTGKVRYIDRICHYECECLNPDLNKCLLFGVSLDFYQSKLYNKTVTYNRCNECIECVNDAIARISPAKYREDEIKSTLVDLAQDSFPGVTWRDVQDDASIRRFLREAVKEHFEGRSRAELLAVVGVL